jgi:hypothetical protein
MDEITKNFDWFRDDGIFAPMINDVGRNEFYKSAIKQYVPDRIVVDIGAGTGLLTVMACQYGARHVYAVEKHPERARYLQQMIDHLDLGNKVTVVSADFLDTELPADVYISETINTQIFGEDMHVLANHARKFGGTFIPNYFDIWAEIYEHHPIFILDQSHSDASLINPQVSIETGYVDKINEDFLQRHPKSSTLYTANQLNKLFTMLPRFTDVKLNRLWRGQSFRVDLNTFTNVDQFRLTVPVNEVSRCDRSWQLVLFWRAGAGNTTVSSNDVWFGNVTKIIDTEHKNPNTDIEIWYDSHIRNWLLNY